MSKDDHAEIAAAPLLLKFARRRTLGKPDYRYDAAQSLNISLADGLPVVASPDGRSLVKTLQEWVKGED